MEWLTRRTSEALRAFFASPVGLLGHFAPWGFVLHTYFLGHLASSRFVLRTRILYRFAPSGFLLRARILRS